MPTPVDEATLPDFSALQSAARTIGGQLVAGAGAIVTLESTVYPGATADLRGPVLAAASGLGSGRRQAGVGPEGADCRASSGG